jgi:hypothetical protein
LFADSKLKRESKFDVMREEMRELSDCKDERRSNSERKFSEIFELEDVKTLIFGSNKEN